jgi:hypothetical protein
MSFDPKPAGSDSGVVNTDRISVVIPTFRRAHLLEAVVAPHVNDPAVAEVIVVDDGSDDATPEVCAQMARRSSKVVSLRQANAGEAAARARGADHASSDVLLILDDDVVAHEGLAAGHLAHHRHRPDPIVVLGYMPPERPGPRRAGQFPIFLYAADYERTCQSYEADASEVLRNLWAGNFSVRRDLFLASPRVPSELPYHQDQVVGWYLAAAGCSGVFDRSLASEHRYVRSAEQFFNDCHRRGRALVQLQELAPPGILPATVESPVMHPLVGVLAKESRSELRSVARGALSAAGRLHLWALETFLGRYLRQVEIRRGYESAVSA